jgi:hypothetical protein
MKARARLRVATAEPRPAVSTGQEALGDLLYTVEDRCNRAGGVLQFIIDADDVLTDEAVAGVCRAALERLCVELDAVAGAAMTARTRPNETPAAVETLRNRLGVPPSASAVAG